MLIGIGYDVALISDATASGYKKHYETTFRKSKRLLWIGNEVQTDLKERLTI